MRVRDIVRCSFQALEDAGVLETRERRGRYHAPPARFNPVWRREQLEEFHYASGGGAPDIVDWQRAVAAVRAFTATSAGRGALPWRIPACGGSFGEVAAEDVMHRLTAALGACGLRLMASDTIAHVAFFEATDTATVAALPEAYGLWLQLRERRPRWNEPVTLRLVVRVRVRIVLLRGGRFDAFADLAMSAPAVSLAETTALMLDRPPPVIGWASFLADFGKPLLSRVSS